MYILKYGFGAPLSLCIGPGVFQRSISSEFCSIFLTSGGVAIIKVHRFYYNLRIHIFLQLAK